MSTTIKHYSKDVGKELDAKISLIIGRKDNGKIDVLHSYLNGVKRRMLVDSGAATSVIHNTQYPRKSRLFRIESVERNYLYNWYKPSDIFWSDEEGEHDDNDDDKDGKNAITIDKQQEELKKKEKELKEDSLGKRDILCSDSLIKNDVTLIHEKGSKANIDLKKIITPNKEEGNMEHVHITDKGSSVKAIVKNKNRNNYSSSLVQS